MGLVHNPRLDAERSQALDAVAEKYAKKYLAHYRGLIAQFNTSRHVITFNCAMGMVSILVDGRIFSSEWSYRERAPIVRLLAKIEEEADWDWAYHLDGERLN